MTAKYALQFEIVQIKFPDPYTDLKCNKFSFAKYFGTFRIEINFTIFKTKLKTIYNNGCHKRQDEDN